MESTKSINEITLFVLIMLMFILVGGSCKVLKAEKNTKDTHPPTPPQYLNAATGIHSNIVRLRWESSKDNLLVKGYKIYRNGAHIATTRKTIYFDRDVEKLIKYDYKIVAFDEHNNISNPSNTVEVKLQDNTLPSVPDNLKASDLASKSLKLLWNKSKDNVEVKGYIVYRNGKEIGKVNTNEFKDTELLSDRVYCYWVKAFDRFNNISRKSKTLKVKTLDGQKEYKNYRVSSELTAKTLSDASIKLAWTNSKNNSNINEYIIYRNKEEIKRLKNTSYVDTSLIPHTKHTYFIKSVDSSRNELDSSNKVTLNTYSKEEPNEEHQDAMDIETVQTGYIDFDGDRDWYKTKVLSKSNLNLELINISEDIDVGFKVYNSNLKLLKTISCEDGNKNVTLEVEPDTYYIKVYGKGYSLDDGYKLKFSSSVSQKESLDLTCEKEKDNLVLNWSKIKAGNSYNVYKLEDNNSYTQVAQVQDTQYTDNNLSEKATYNYKVKCIDSNDEEIISDSVKIDYVSETTVGGTINKDTVWNSLKSPYIVKRDLKISKDATLKIMPGTKIKFRPRVKMYIYGQINAIGTSEEKIEFTSTYKEPVRNSYKNQYWSGIFIKKEGEFKGKNILVQYGGREYSINGKLIRSNIYNKGKLNLINSNIIKSCSNAAGIYNNSNKRIIVKDCTIKNNSGSGIVLNACKDVLIKDNTFNNNAHNGDVVLRYKGKGKVEINNNKFLNSTYGLNVLTYKKDTKGSLNICNNVCKSTNPLNITLSGFESPIKSLFKNMQNNKLQGRYGQVSLKGIINRDIVIPNDKYNNYVLNNYTTITTGKQMTIEKGVTLKVLPGKRIQVYGKFNAVGEKRYPIKFTTVSQDSLYSRRGNNYWRGILIKSRGEFIGNNVIVERGGYNNSSNIKVEGKLSLTNSKVKDSKSNGIVCDTDIQPFIKYNSIMNNKRYGIYNKNSNKIKVNASYNYWGSIYGPSVYVNGKWQDNGDKVSNGVIYKPWLAHEFKTQIHFGQAGTHGVTGNYSKQFTDMSIPSIAQDIKFKRTYNSGDDRENRLLGRGWTFSFEGSIKDYQYKPDLKIVRLPNGSVQTFTQHDDGTYTANDSRNKLVKKTDGTYVLTTKDQFSYGFNTEGYLSWLKDRNNNTITINVDSNGKVNSVTDSVSRTYTIGYNASGQISSITDPADRVVNYEYENGLLVKVVDPMGHVTRYSYDAQGYLSEIRDHNSNLIESITYDHTEGKNQHKVSQITDEYGNVKNYTYDNTNRKCTITDTNDRQTIKWYDDENYVIKVQDAQGEQKTIKYFTYDGINKYGEVKSITDRNDNTTSYLRDTNGNVIRITNPDSSYKEFEYDDKNNLIEEKDECGKYTFYVYDSEKKNLLKKAQPLNGTDQYQDGISNNSNFAITEYTYYSNGQVKTITDPEDNTTTNTYDAYGNKDTVTDPENNTKDYRYNNIGILEYEISPKGYRKDYTYDDNGNLEKKVLTSGNGETTRITYDNEGRVTKKVSPNLYDSALDDIANHSYTGDHGYRYTLYSHGKKKTITDPQDNTTSFTYDLYGNKTSMTRPNGSIYEYEYDVMNRLSKVYFKADSQATPVLLEEYTYTILSDGKTQKTHIKYLNDTESATTVYTYDYANRLVQKQNPDGTTTSTRYNPNGTKDTTTDEKGNTTHYAYDGLNRLTKTWTPIEDDKYTYTETVYDKAGRKIEEKKCKDKVNLDVVPTSNLITKYYTYYKNDKLKSVSNDIGLKKEYEYDDDGNLSKEIVYTDGVNKNITEYVNNYFGKPSEKKVHVTQGDIYPNSFDDTLDLIISTTYTYDKNGNLKTEKTGDVTTTYEYDNLDRQISVSKPGVDEYDNSVTIEKSVTYNFEDKPLTKTDANNNTTTYTYNQRGLLEKKTNAKDGVTAYYYDTGGRKIAQVTPKNYDDTKTLSQMNRTEYVYDNMDRLKAKRQIYYDTDTSTWENYISKAYRYDNKGNVIKELDSLGYESGTGTMDEKIDSGYGTEYTYNHQDMLITELDPVSKERTLSFTKKYEYDGAGRKVSETNAKGVVKNYYYDDDGNITKTTVRETINDPEQIIQTKTYDYLGNVTSKTDGEGNTINYEYNAFEKVRKIVYPGDTTIPENIEKYQYDVFGNLKKKSDTFGTVDLYNYDVQNRQTSHTQQKSDGTESITTSTKYDENGNARFETDGNGVTTEKTYDKLNRLKTTSVTVTNTNNDQHVHTTTYEYDKNGNKTSETDWRGNRHTYIYDPLNRLIEKKDPYQNTIEKLVYDHNNNQIKSYDAQDKLTQYEYDKNNRLLSETDPENHTTSKTYDDAGNIKTKTDGNGNTTTYTYDEFNRLESITNELDEVTSYTYDLNGNKLTQTDGAGNVTTYEYNVRNKLKTKIDHGGRTGTEGDYTYDPDKTVNYTYYANGKIKTKTDRNGKTTTYVYDNHKRVISKSVGTINISYTYDDNNNQLTITDNTGTTTRTYDELNRVKTKDVPNIDTTTYCYDIINEVSDGQIAERITDPKGNVTTKVYDKAERLKEVRVGSDTTTYNYYADGTKQSIVYPDGSCEEYTYYDDNLLYTLTNKKSDGTIIDTYTYIYDAAHNKTSKTDAKGTTDYTYDELNRLKTVTEPSGKVTSYTFDDAGNRLTKTVTVDSDVTTTKYNYNEQNRLLDTITDLNGVTTRTKEFTYDNNGNVLTITLTPYVDGNPQTPQVTTNTYDELNQLVTTETPEGKNITNTYNGEGLRVGKDVDGTLTRYLYEYDKVVLELNEDGSRKAQNIYGTNLISRTVDSQTLYYFYNGHADVTALMNTSGSIVETYYYDAFGNITESTGTADNPYRYAGYQYDEETGTYYLISRMYDPTIARFLQEDTYRGSEKDPLSLNVYTYAHNNPIKYFDPTGHWAEDGSDIKYKPYDMAYDKLAELTRQWENTDNNEEKEKIHEQANKVRRVADVQISLNDLKYKDKYNNKLTVDGILKRSDGKESNTEYVVKQFQKNNYIKQTGKLDDWTYKTITTDIITSAIFLNQQKGAGGFGHSAVVLKHSHGGGTLYSYTTSETPEELSKWDMLKIASSTEMPGDLTKKKMDKKTFKNFMKSGKIRNVRYTTRQGLTYNDRYNRYLVLPVKNKRKGSKMVNRAETIVENPGNYDLYSHNCNYVAQTILEAGDLNFTPTSGGSGKLVANQAYNIVKDNTLVGYSNWDGVEVDVNYKGMLSSYNKYLKKDGELGIVPNGAYKIGVNQGYKHGDFVQR